MKMKKSLLQKIIKEEISRLSPKQKKMLHERLLKEDSWQNDMYGLSISLKNAAELAAQISRMKDMSLSSMQDQKHRLATTVSDCLSGIKKIKF